MGDPARIIDGKARINLNVSTESAYALLLKIDIIKNGAIWQTIAPYSPFYADILVDKNVSEDRYYRVEVTSVELSIGTYHFAWSNPVFVTVP